MSLFMFFLKNESYQVVFKPVFVNNIQTHKNDIIFPMKYGRNTPNSKSIVPSICEGMNINENARYGILTKSFNDTIRIIEAIGGVSNTVHEYCGFGDLILTSTSFESRNHTLGILYGQRLIIDEAASGIVFEGKNSIRAVKDICTNYDIHSDIVDFVYDVIIERTNPVKAFNTLWDKIE